MLEYEVNFHEKVRNEDGSYLDSHECVLRFFTEDGTLEITEKPVRNNGRSEKRLVKRHRVEKSSGGGGFVGVEDLFPGSFIVVYGMNFEIIRGTALAENYISRRLGNTTLNSQQPYQQLSLGPASSITGSELGGFMFDGESEGGNYSEAQGGFNIGGDNNNNNNLEFISAKKDRVASWLTQQDFAQQPTTLSLDCVWDDSASLYGDVHNLKLNYSLLDDTVDVVLVESEKFENKYSGTKNLLCRQRLPKGVDLAAPVQGMDSRMRLTGSRGGTASGGRRNPQFVDANTPGTFYHWSELLPGTDFNLLGRKAHVVGFANVPSERFVRNQLPSAMVSAAARRSRPSVRAVTRRLPVYEHPVPEHLGYGTYEDSMRSVRAIAPHAPPSRSGGANHLRFKMQFRAELLSTLPSDQGRIFIISFFVDDNTATVFESSPRNAGRPSATFAARAKYVKRYDRLKGGEHRPVYYCMQDFYAGAILIINGHHFKLTEVAPGMKLYAGQASHANSCHRLKHLTCLCRNRDKNFHGDPCPFEGLVK